MGVTVETLRRPLAELPDPLALPRFERPRGAAAVDVAVTPPGSKSLTNRALLLAALAEGESVLRGPLLDADDAQRMLAAITQLGAAHALHADGSLRVQGVGGRWRDKGEDLTLFLNNAGTATRFLAAAALLSPSPVVIDGNARMRQRPIGELGELLRELGAGVEHLAGNDCPPVRITPPAGNAPVVDTLDIEPTASSQFVSALLLTAPFLPRGLTLRLHGTITSETYVAMTVRLLEDVGASVRTAEGLRVVRVLPQEGARLPAFSHDVEPDASGGTYFWAAGALVPGARVAVRGLDGRSLQGDAKFPQELARMGAGVELLGPLSDRGEGLGTGPRASAIAVRGPRANPMSIGAGGGAGASGGAGATLRPTITDMSGMPDAAVTLAVVAAFASGTSVIRGVRTLRVKETDRIAALQAELAKIGVTVADHVNGDADTMTVTPPAGGVDCSPDVPPVHFKTYDDHRMAMALSLVGLRRPNVVIHDPGCVAKTYPTYFADLARLWA